MGPCFIGKRGSRFLFFADIGSCSSISILVKRPRGVDYDFHTLILLVAERFVHGRNFIDLDAVCDKKAGIDLALFYTLQQRDIARLKMG